MERPEEFVPMLEVDALHPYDHHVAETKQCQHRVEVQLKQDVFFLDFFFEELRLIELLKVVLVDLEPTLLEIFRIGVKGAVRGHNHRCARGILCFFGLLLIWRLDDSRGLVNGPREKEGEENSGEQASVKCSELTDSPSVEQIEEH